MPQKYSSFNIKHHPYSKTTATPIKNQGGRRRRRQNLEVETLSGKNVGFIEDTIVINHPSSNSNNTNSPGNLFFRGNCVNIDSTVVNHQKCLF